jgi:hypothetical protein
MALVPGCHCTSQVHVSMYHWGLPTPLTWTHTRPIEVAAIEGQWTLASKSLNGLEIVLRSTLALL